MLLLAFIIGVLVVLIFYYIRLPFKYWEKKNVPHPPVSYLFGNVSDVVLLKKSLGQFYHEIYNKYSHLSYVGLYRTRTPCILIRHPELIQQVLVKSFNSFRDNDVNIDENVDPIFAKNPFASKGQQWKERRNQSAQSFTAKKIKEMYPLIEGVANNLVAFIRDNADGSPKGVDTKELCMKYTMDVVMNCALGIEANSFINPYSDYIKMINKIVSPSFANTIKFLLVFIFPSLSKLLRIQVIPDDSGAYFKTLVKETLEYRVRNKIKRGDFLDSMNELQQKIRPNMFTNDDITAHALSFFTDGTETSAIVLSFTLYELSLHPEVQENIRQEIEETRRNTEGKLNYETIQNMEYLDNVILENMRKNTPVFFTVRLCTEQIDLEPPEANGERISINRKTPIIISFHSIHHDPKYYPNPSLYDPTRFSEENIETRPKYTYLAFGEGPRICLGQRFALGQIKIAIVHLIEEFDIRINKSTTVPYVIDPHYFMLAAKGGIRLDFHKRH